METATERNETPETEDVQQTGTPAGDTEETPQRAEEEPESFPAEYVRKLRSEAAENRTRAKDRDKMAHRLHTSLVAATGRLADPTDLPYDAEHLDDPDSLSEAIDTLLQAKPHLASRMPSGDVGQGATTDATAFDLLGALRANAS